jgi:hypothetical protein
MDRIWSGLKVVIKGLFQWPPQAAVLFLFANGIDPSKQFFQIVVSRVAFALERKPDDFAATSFC